MLVNEKEFCVVYCFDNKHAIYENIHVCDDDEEKRQKKKRGTLLADQFIKKPNCFFSTEWAIET